MLARPDKFERWLAKSCGGIILVAVDYGDEPNR